MKNKNLIKKSILFAAMFLAVFFFAFKNAKANCYDDCASDSDPQGCYDGCSNIDRNVEYTDSDGCVSENDSDFCCAQFGGSWNGSSCSPAGNCVSDAECQREYGGDYVCDHGTGECTENADMKAGKGFTEQTCSQDNGYWNSGTCYDSRDAYCEETKGDGYTMNVLTGNCTGTQGAGCTNDSDCAVGVSCDVETETCKDGSIRNFFGGSDSPSSAVNNLLQTSKSINIPGIGSVPAGTTISPSGVVTSPSGAVLGTVSGSVLSGLEQTGNVYQYGSSNFTGPLPSQRKCSVGFVEVGGVCFPDKTVTGLSDAPISNIIANLFVWMMGIFITLAIIAFIISGIMYFLSSGDADLAKKAKTNAINALIGIVIGFSGYIIVQAIARALSGETGF